MAGFAKGAGVTALAVKSNRQGQNTNIFTWFQLAFDQAQ